MTRLTSLIAKSLLTLLIVSGTLATDLQAQSDAVTVSVPFPFTVDTQTIAPGTYRFSLLSSQFLLSVLNVKTGNMYIFTVQPELQRSPDHQGHLVFRSAQGGGVLNEIHFRDTTTFSEVIQRHADGRMEAKRSSPGNSISVAQR